jgi:hypothetical protein
MISGGGAAELATESENMVSTRKNTRGSFCDITHKYMSDS